MIFLILIAAIIIAIMAILRLFVAPTINVAALSEQFLETIWPYLPPEAQAALRRAEGYWVCQDELQRLQQIHCEIVAHQERTYRAEIAILEARSARTLARAKKSFLASLPENELGLLGARLQATADAEARAQFDFQKLRQEIEVLHNHLGELHLENRRLQRLQRDVKVVRETRGGSGLTVVNITVPKGTFTQLLAMAIGEQLSRDEVKDRTDGT